MTHGGTGSFTVPSAFGPNTYSIVLDPENTQERNGNWMRSAFQVHLEGPVMCPLISLESILVHELGHAYAIQYGPPGLDDWFALMVGNLLLPPELQRFHH